MFVNKCVEIFTENEKAENFEAFMADEGIEYRHAGVNYAYGAHKYIFEDEKNFGKALRYLDDNTIYYHSDDYIPEGKVLADFFHYGEESHSVDGWLCQKDSFDDIEILEGGYVQAKILFDAEKCARLNTKAFIDSKANEAVLCQTLLDNYGDVILTDEQAKMVNHDTVISLPNGFNVDLAEADRLYLKLNKGLVSLDGRWYDVSKLDKDFYSFHKSQKIKEVKLSVNTATFVEKDVNAYYSTSAETLTNGKYRYNIPISRIKRNLETALPYIEKAVLFKSNWENKIDVTKELTAPYPEGYYMRKYHLEFELPDGNIYQGFINITADYEEDLPAAEDVKGSFWVEKITMGWLGKFELDGNEPADRCEYHEDLYKTLTHLDNGVVTSGVYRPESGCPKYVGAFSEKLAQEIYEYNQPIDVRGVKIPRFEGRLEDCIKSIETHFFKSEKNAEINQTLRQNKQQEKVQE